MGKSGIRPKRGPSSGLIIAVQKGPNIAVQKEPNIAPNIAVQRGLTEGLHRGQISRPQRAPESAYMAYMTHMASIANTANFANIANSANST